MSRELTNSVPIQLWGTGSARVAELALQRWHRMQPEGSPLFWGALQQARITAGREEAKDGWSLNGFAVVRAGDGKAAKPGFYSLAGYLAWSLAVPFVTARFFSHDPDPVPAKAPESDDVGAEGEAGVAENVAARSAATVTALAGLADAPGGGSSQLGVVEAFFGNASTTPTFPEFS